MRVFSHSASSKSHHLHWALTSADGCGVVIRAVRKAFSKMLLITPLQHDCIPTEWCCAAINDYGSAKFWILMAVQQPQATDCYFSKWKAM